MTAKEIYKGTKKFPTRLLLLNLLCVLIAAVVFAIFGIISLVAKSAGLLMGAAFVSLIIYATASKIVEHYIGYMFKYGSIHAIALAHRDGSISKDYFNESVEYIKSGFLKANAYFVVDKLVSSAVRGVTKLVNFVIGFLPDNIKNAVDTFINIYLNYIDECCLGWSMLHPEENVIKTSCDGIVIYYQNAKNMLKPAAKTTLRVIIVDFLIFISGCLFIFFMPLAVLWWIVMYSIITPYLNHRILCDTMVPYLEFADKTEIKTDLYAKLNKCKPFQKLRSKMEDPMFDPAPGNESINAKVMREAAYEPEEDYTEEVEEYEEQSTVSDEPVVERKAPVVERRIPEPVSIPEPPTEGPTEEQIMWQKAWNRMSVEQKRKYNSMTVVNQKAWKAQILKALFNYELK